MLRILLLSASRNILLPSTTKTPSSFLALDLRFHVTSSFTCLFVINFVTMPFTSTLFFTTFNLKVMPITIYLPDTDNPEYPSASQALRQYQNLVLLKTLKLLIFLNHLLQIYLLDFQHI